MSSVQVAETSSSEEEVPSSELEKEIANLLDDSVYQNQAIRGGIYFISEEDLEKLPKQITALIEKRET